MNKLNINNENMTKDNDMNVLNLGEKENNHISFPRVICDEMGLAAHFIADSQIGLLMMRT